MRALALVALAACGSHAPAPPITGTAPPPPATAPPTLAWGQDGFALTDLPAVTRDGALVVFAVSETDGGRGNPSLRLESRDRDDLGRDKIKILGVEEQETMFDEAGPRPALTTRIDAASGWLADLHRRAELIALPKLEVDTSDGYTQHAARVGAVTLDWQHDRLTITSDKQLVTSRATPATWLAPHQPHCDNPAKLGAAWVDLERKLALVEIAYNGADMCWEPTPQKHVVSW